MKKDEDEIREDAASHGGKAPARAVAKERKRIDDEEWPGGATRGVFVS